MNDPTPPPPAPALTPDAVTRTNPARPPREPIELATLPKEIGYMLLSAGVVGFVLPGPGTPALIAGGAILWPQGFGKVEGWFKKKFPDLHRGGMGHLQRYLTDLETRYPGATRDDAKGEPGTEPPA